ncbi:MAG: aldehyde dehydrogenase family protein, partial [Parvularculaceae bacterium]|nr:aldehyde dehydrogenase family protein [Parvularculaceae bacterium]
MVENRFFREACYVGGAWVGGQDAIKVDNPATGKIIGTAPRFGRPETAKAIDAAADAFLAWRDRTAEERADFCRKFFEALMDHQ